MACRPRHLCAHEKRSRASPAPPGPNHRGTLTIGTLPCREKRIKDRELVTVHTPEKGKSAVTRLELLGRGDALAKRSVWTAFRAFGFRPHQLW